ncbi:lysis protein [Pseudomonas sp. dw_358]|uniref:lysis protein n=1 Tax=Pseudomonas sp. dw_358 TaxID=2720083 RepID=UPI001BD4D708|nr:lysis protein [Pseudomonas sp. dw_358]
MKETLIKWAVIAFAALLCMALGFGIAWKWQANSYTAQLDTQKSNFQADLTKIAAAAAEQARTAVEHQQQAEQALADLDAKSSKEKADALAQNDALRAAVAAGTRRLRIAGTCTSHPSGSDVPQTADSASLGDGSSIELDPASGQHVLDIRAGAISDQAKLKALQAYVTNVCLK